MKSKIHKKANLSKMFFTLLFGLSTILSFGQPDPPPNEVPLDGNIVVLISVALIISVVFIIKRESSTLNDK